MQRHGEACRYVSVVCYKVISQDSKHHLDYLCTEFFETLFQCSELSVARIGAIQHHYPGIKIQVSLKTIHGLSEVGIGSNLRITLHLISVSSNEDNLWAITKNSTFRLPRFQRSQMMEQIIFHFPVLFTQVEQDQRYGCPLSNEVLVASEGPCMPCHVHFTELANPWYVNDAHFYSGRSACHILAGIWLFRVS